MRQLALRNKFLLLLNFNQMSLKTVFLVEDDEDDQSFFTSAIATIEQVVLQGIADNGQEALDKLKYSIMLPDIIFMDINMPKLNGKDCLIEMKRDARLHNIPVVIMSTSTLEADLVSRLGAKAFIKKPSEEIKLRTKLKEVIEALLVPPHQVAV